jgi:hypothetical protein
MTNYPKPDFKKTLKLFTGMALSLVAFHWAPDIAVWIHAKLYGEVLVIDQQSYRTALVVVYAMVGIAATVNLAGLTWAIWHNRKLKR